MDTLLADLEVDQGHDKNDCKQNQSGSAGTALMVLLQRFIDESDHGIQASGGVCGAK